jgi:hypothetical protein
MISCHNLYMLVVQQICFVSRVRLVNSCSELVIDLILHWIEEDLKMNFDQNSIVYICIGKF